MKTKKCLSAVLALTLVLNTGAVNVFASEPSQEDLGNTQTVSEPETVYVNSYGLGERSVSFNDHWRFYLGDASGAQTEAYNDSAWDEVNLPHDYSIDQGFSTAAPAEQESGYVPGGTGWYRKAFTLSEDMQGKTVSIDFDGVYMNAAIYLNGVQLGTHPYGYTSFSFELPEEHLNFGGRENILAVKVEHKQPSSRWYSGSGIYRDVNLTVTDPVHVSRFGTQVTTPDIAQGKGTVHVVTEVQNNSMQEALLSVQQTVYERGKKEPVVTGKVTEEQQLQAGKSLDITDSVEVPDPKLWSTTAPNLYTVRTDVYVNEVLTDSYETDFGFRWVNVTAENGFFLNGKNMKLRGMCMHHDQGALGSEAWYRSVERQVELLQEMGVNAIRVTHNPASEVLIDICNRKGMMLVEEAFDSWLSGKAGNTEDYGKWFDQPIESGNQIAGGEDCSKWAEFDLKEMVMRGRNAPSIIMWSLGNEVFQQTIDSSRHDEYPDLAKKLIQWTAQEDATRYVTFGDNWFKGNVWADSPAVDTALVFASADQYGVPGGLPGYNYGNSNQIWNGYSRGWMVYGSETASAVNSRGVYDRKSSNSDGGVGDRRLTSYDKSNVSWGHSASAGLWITMRQDYNAGEFVWTGFDYIGEPTPYNWQGTGSNGTWPNVAKSSYFGVIDTAGLPKDSYYLYQSQWNDHVNTLHVLPVWNRDEIMIDGSGKTEVVVYSDAPVIKLYLNGKEVGTASAERTDTPTGGYQNYTQGTGCFDSGKASDHTSLYATFQVPYEEGKLEAKAFEADGKTPILDTRGRSLVETASNPNRLRAASDRKVITADGKDLSYVTIDVTDTQGRFVNGAEPEISVSVSGNGRLLALDNGVQNDVTPYSSPKRRAGKGKLVAIVQSAEDEGEFTVTASAPGYVTASETVSTIASDEEGDAEERKVSSYYISRNYYVKQGETPKLPNTVTVNYSDGTSETKNVTWDKLPEQDTYSVSGIIADAGLRISVNVIMIGEVAGVLNYSMAIGKDAVLSLPQTRPAVLSDGTVLAAEFPVKWEIPDNVTGAVGTVRITGKAAVFDQIFDVTACVRVTGGSYKDGDEALPNVPEMYIGGVSSKSDAGVAEVLNRLKDKKQTKEDVAFSGRGTLDFRLDTAIDLKNFTLYLKDTAPTSDTMKVYASSSNGASWTAVDCKVSNKRADGVTIRTYTPEETVSETWFRVEFKRQTELVELEMNTRIPTFDVGSQAALASLKAGGYIAGREVLEKSFFCVPETELSAADLTAVGKDNTSVTVLEKDSKGVIRILLESEDHAERSIYSVWLGRNYTGSDDPGDESRDYPYTEMTLSAPSVEKGGSPARANDGKKDTIWHSNWGGGIGSADLTNDPENRYLEVELPEITEVDGVRYLPRATDLNGIVTKYSVKISTDGEEWKEAAAGSWSTAVEWKLARFDAVQARWIRLYGVETATNEGKPQRYMSAAEIRVRFAADPLYSGNTTVTLAEEDQSADYTGYALTPQPLVVCKSTPEAEGITLIKDIDYTLSYRDNIEPGNAVVQVAGKGKYSGIVETSFTINPVDVTVTGYEPVAVTTGKNVHPMLPGTVIANTSVGEQVMEVRWDKAGSSALDSFGTFTLYGTVMETDERIPAQITVSDVIGVRQVTLTAVKGIQPAMPETVMVYYSNGDIANQEVVWDLEDADFSQTGVTEISGMTGKAKARATVRIEENSPDANNTPVGMNLALKEDGEEKPTEWPRTFAYVSSEGDPVHHATDGVKNFVSSPDKNIWCDWESGTYHTNPDAEVGAADHLPFVATAFGISRSADNADQKKYTANRVSIGFMEEDGSNEHKVRLASDYKIEYYSASNGVIPASRLVNSSANACSNTRGWGADNPIKAHEGWTEVTYIGSKPEVPDLNSFKKMLDIAFVPVETTAIRITLTPQAENWTGLEEFEVYYDPIIKNSGFEISVIKIDGEDVLAQFDSETKTLNVNAHKGEITAAATKNASITILEAVNGTAKIVFLPENGDEAAKQEYTVNFARSQTAESHVISSEDDFVVLETGIASKDEKVVFKAQNGYKFETAPAIIKSENRTETGIVLNESEEGYSFAMPDYPVTIAGRVTPIIYPITYVLNGGETDGNPTAYTIETPDFILKNPVKQGSAFLGWTGGEVTEPTVSMKIKSGTIGDLTFTANWREGSKYKVSFESNGGSPVDQQEVEMETGKILEPDAPVKFAYIFEGWYSDAQLTRAWDFASDTVRSDMILYAKWTPAEITVNTKLPVRYLDQPFSLPEYIRITVSEKTFGTSVVWNREDLELLTNAAEVGTYTVRGTLGELDGREIQIPVSVSPDHIIYFIDSGAAVFTEKGSLIAEANADTMRNHTPDQAYTESSGWGFTNPADILEVNGSGDAYSTIRNFKSDVTGQTLVYQLALEAGTYQVAVGFYDPWAQWAGDARHAKITLTDAQDHELAVRKDHHISARKDMVQFQEVTVEEGGDISVNIAPLKTGSNSDVMVSFIVVSGEVESTLPEVDKTSLRAAIDSAMALNEKDYTVSTYAVLFNAMEEAEAVYEDKNATAEQVQIQIENLAAAAGQLKIPDASDYQGLLEELKEKEAALAAKDRELNAAKEEVGRLTEELHTAQEEVSTLTGSLQEAEDKIAELQENAEENEEKIAALQIRVKELETQLAQAQEKVLQLEAALAQKQDEIETLQAQNKNLMEEVLKAKAEIEKIKKEVEEEKRKAEEAKREAEEAIRKAQEEARKAQEEADRLRAELEKEKQSSILKKGDTVSANGIRYRVKSSEKKQMEAYGVTRKTAKTIRVEDSLEIKGITYQVTSISKGAFANLKKVSSVIIGKNVISIGSKAFYGNRRLKNIQINSKKLKFVGKLAWKGISAKAVIKVPKAKKRDYIRKMKGKGQKQTVKIK